MRSRGARQRLGQYQRPLALLLSALILSGDSGVVALKDFTLQQDVRMVADSHAESTRAGTAELGGPRSTLGESAQTQAVLRPLKAPAAQLMPSRDDSIAAGSGKLAFADGSLSSASSATSSTSTGVFPFDPVSLSITLVFTLITGVLNHLAGLNLARAALLRNNFDKEVQGIVGETAESMRNMGKAYSAVTGDIGRRLRDALSETALSVVQYLPDAEILAAARRVVDQQAHPILIAHRNKNTGLPDPFNVTTDERLGPVRRGLRVYDDPSQMLKKVGSSATAADVQAKAIIFLRQSLMALVEDDFNLLSGAGSLGRFGDDTNPADAIRIIDFTTELSAPARTLMETAASVTGSSANMDISQDQLLRMRALAMRNAAAAGDAKAVEEYEAELLKRTGMKPQRLQSGDLSIAAMEKQETVEMIGDFFGQATDGIKNSLILAKAAHSAVTPAAAHAFNVVTVVSQYMGFIGSIAALTTAVLAGVGLYQSQKAEGFEIFEGGRNTGIAHERGESDRRITAAVMCRMMDSLRTSINTFLAIPMAKVKSDKAEVLNKMLGLTAFQLNSDAKIRVAVTLYTRLCAMYSAMIQRINALFRANGECKVQLVHLTGAADTVPGQGQSQLETSVARFDTCKAGMECEDDIYDVQLVDHGDAFTVLHGAGYEYLADPADANSPNKKLIAAWKDASPEGQNLRTVRFAGELNAEVETVGLKKIETEKQKAPTEDSRKLMVLRWKALKNADTALSLAFKPKDPVDQPVIDAFQAYFARLKSFKYPVSDLVVSLLNKQDGMDEIAFAAQGPQADLQASGYQLLMPRFSKGAKVKHRVPMIEKMLYDFGNASSVKYTSELLKQADVKKGRGDSKPYTFIHIMRGNGISALKDVVLAPFASVDSKILADSESKAYDVKNSFVTKLVETAKAQSKEVEARPTGMVLPWEQCNAWARARHFKETWLVDGFWTFINPIERKQTKDFDFGLHEFHLNCTAPAGSTAVWERVAVSPYTSNNRGVARLLKPYLWINRRYVLPKFSSGDDKESPDCPWMCDSTLKSVIIPPAVRPFDALKKETVGAFHLAGPIP